MGRPLGSKNRSLREREAAAKAEIREVKLKRKIEELKKSKG